MWEVIRMANTIKRTEISTSICEMKYLYRRRYRVNDLTGTIMPYLLLDLSDRTLGLKCSGIIGNFDHRPTIAEIARGRGRSFHPVLFLPRGPRFSMLVSANSSKLLGQYWSFFSLLGYLRFSFSNKTLAQFAPIFTFHFDKTIPRKFCLSFSERYVAIGSALPCPAQSNRNRLLKRACSSVLQ